MPVRISMAWLCILCAGGLGFLKGQRLRKRIRMLERIVRLLEHMERELEFGREPLPEVFKKLSEKNTGELKTFLEHTAVQMQQGKDNIAAVFTENIRKYLSEGDLFAEDLQRFHDRMPGIAPPEMAMDWLHPDSDPGVIIRNALARMTFTPAS